jgi:hypothetical protein
MSDLDFELQRYAALSDRLALGEELTDDEHAFLERMAASEPACELENALYAELESLDAPLSERSRSLVETALAELAKGSDSRAARPQARARRSWGRGFYMTLGGVAVAAAAAALLMVPERSHRSANAAAKAALNDKHTSSRSDETAARVELVFISGDVQIDGESVARSSSLLREGSVLSVGAGVACIAMDPAIDVCAAPGTELKLTAMRSAQRRLDLLQGKVAVQLEKQPEGSSLSIVSDGVWSTAIGTAFSVQREADAGVRTTVLHGKVGVSRRARQPEQVISAHQRALVRPGLERAEIVPIGRNEESPEWALLGPTRLWNVAVAATLELSEVPQDGRALLDGQELGIAPISTLVPVGHHRIEVRVGGATVWSRELTLSAGERAVFSLANVGSAEEPLEPASTASAPKRAPRKAAAAPSAAELLKQARHALREGSLGEAAATYETLLRQHARSEEARIGLLSLAELQLEHLGQPNAALTYADRYLASASGSLRPEAEETRIRALRALGRRAEERAAIQAFLKAYPESLRARTLAQRLDALQPPSRTGDSEAQ